MGIGLGIGLGIGFGFGFGFGPGSFDLTVRSAGAIAGAAAGLGGGGAAARCSTRMEWWEIQGDTGRYGAPLPAYDIGRSHKLEEWALCSLTLDVHF